MAVQYKLALVILTLICIAHQITSVKGLQNDFLTMDASQIISKLSENAEIYNDINFEGYKQLQDIIGSFYNATFWDQFIGSLQELDLSKTPKNNSQCIADSLKLMTDAMQFKPYTIKLLDTAGKLPPGVFQGHLVWFGDFQSCMDTAAADGSFHGKYCTTQFYLPSLGAIFQKTPIGVGLCMPRSCDNDTVVDLLYMALHVLPFDVYPTHAWCTEPKPYTHGDIAAIVILSILAFFIFMGTFVDIYGRISSTEDNDVVKTTGSTNVDPSNYQDGDARSHSDTSALVDSDILDSGLISPRAFEDRSMEISQEVNTVFTRIKGVVVRVLLAMSLITNAEKILDTSRKSQELSALNGIRVISMSWVILGHTYVFAITYLDNPMQFYNLARRFTFQPIINGTLSVDSFFFLSGLLVAYLTFRELHRKEGKLNWLMFYFHRFWRLTPVYMLSLMFYVTLYSHLLYGPGDSQFVDSPGLQSCKTYWWTNLLYINNFIPDFLNSCMPWAWYLANDMQFFIISPVFIILLYRFPKVGFAAVLGTIAASVTLTSVVAYENDYHLLLTSQTNPNQTVAISGDIYERPYYRISPYLVGIITGYLIYKHRGYLRMPKVAAVLGWAIAVTIGMSVTYGLYGNYKDSTEPSKGAAALFVGVSRFSWSLALSWVAFACVCGYGGPVNKLLSWSVWGPLGRLTYSVYLIHPMIMYWYLLGQQTSLHLTDPNMAYLFIGNIVMSYLVAFVVSLFMEAPMIQLEKIVFNRL